MNVPARLPGKTIGRYQLEERIGQGAMAYVHRAHDPEIRRDLAIKILNQEFRRDAESVARFLREARAAGSLSHPNIVTVYDVGETQGLPYLAMELLQGKTLDAVIAERGAFPVADVINIAIQLADALRYAHGLGIVHRDIKPSNIMLSPDGRTAKLLDFGIARVGEAHPANENGEMVRTQIGQVIGTPRYMSPEQAQGRPLDGRSDYFSLGAILYELVTGKPAFDGTSIATVALQITTQQPPPIATIPECPRGLRFLIEKLLAKDPERRFADGAQLVEALKREAAAIKTASQQDSVRRLPLHLRFTLLTGAAVAAVLGISIAWVVQQQYAAMERVATASGGSIATFVANNVALPMMENASAPESADWLPVQAFAKTAAMDPDIGELMIIDSGGTIQAAADADMIGARYQAPPVSQVEDSGVAVSSVTQDGEAFFQFNRPIEYAGRNVGSVEVRVRKAALEAAAASAQALLVGLGILVFAAGIGISLVAGRIMLGPMRRLDSAMREAAKGRLDFRITHGRRDEFGQLFDNFNALATEVQERLERAERAGAPQQAATRSVDATMVRQPALQRIPETGT